MATPNFWYARLDYVHNQNNEILQRFRRSDGGGKHSQVKIVKKYLKAWDQINVFDFSSWGLGHFGVFGVFWGQNQNLFRSHGTKSFII